MIQIATTVELITKDISTFHYTQFKQQSTFIVLCRRWKHQPLHKCSLRSSSPIWASETSLARTRERAAKPRGAEERRACNHPLQIFICTSPRRREIPLAEKWRSGNQSWLITGQAGTRFVCVSNLVLRGIRLVPRTCFSPQSRRALLM